MRGDSVIFGPLVIATVLLSGIGHTTLAARHGAERVAREIAARFTWDAMAIAFICTDDPRARECDGPTDQSTL
jgi:type III secretory pathway component EscV